MNPLKSLVEYRGPITLAARLRTRNREEGKTRTRYGSGKTRTRTGMMLTPAITQEAESGA